MGTETMQLRIYRGSQLAARIDERGEASFYGDAGRQAKDLLEAAHVMERGPSDSVDQLLDRAVEAGLPEAGFGVLARDELPTPPDDGQR
jgi:hypothetical protein